MYNLLIVDDEPIIADGLCEMITAERKDKLHAYQVYSPEEAFQFALRVKLDIVISDILMPRTNGLDLQVHIRKYWPNCQFIFVTGHDDFPFIQRALQNGSVSYILKTQGDDVILKAVDEACARIDQALSLSTLLQDAKLRLDMAKPLLQNRQFECWLGGQKMSREEMGEQMRQLDFSLSPDAGILPVLIAVDPSQTNIKPKPYLMDNYLMQSITHGLLPNVQAMYFQTGRNSSVAVFQGEDGFEAMVLGTLEQLQESCHERIGIHISMAASTKSIEWPEIATVYERLCKRLYASGGSDVLLTVPPLDNGEAAGEESQRQECRRKIVLMCEHLKFWRQSLFEALFHDLLAGLDGASASLRIEAALQLLSMAGEAIRSLESDGQTRLLNEFAQLDIKNWMNDWPGCLHQFRELFKSVFHVYAIERDKRAHTLIDMLHRYISDHLSEDLSLTRLSEVACYSAAYLSTLYKGITGQSLIDYVGKTRLHKAKELLLEPSARINQVAKCVGFESQQYFHRYFKKMTGMTPNEYKNSMLEK